MVDKYQLGDEAADVLREVGNIGAAHAATALSQILHQGVEMQVPQVELIPFDEIANVVGGPEAVVACVYLKVTGDLSGNMFFIQSLESAKQLTGEILPENKSRAELNELELSALGEMGNILTASYLSSLTDFTQLKMYPSIPYISIDMAQAILTIGLLSDAPLGDYALVIHTTIHNTTAIERAHIFLLPDPGQEIVLLHALGMEIQQ